MRVLAENRGLRLSPGLNIYSLDSDGDSKSDFEEVEAMANPLGAGRLGDHLK